MKSFFFLISQSLSNQKKIQSINPYQYNEIGAWVPVASISAFDKLETPQKLEIFGNDYVLWNTDKIWTLQKDICPHRFAPLSQGRIEGDCIQCPYHGWEFNSSGSCTKIPQLNDKPSNSINVDTIPLYITYDLIWGFFDFNITGEFGLRSNTPDKLHSNLEFTKDKNFFTRELPYSFDILIENFMDPSHIPYAHHGLQGRREDGSPIEMNKHIENETHLEISFEDNVNNKTRTGIVSFQRPARYHYRTIRENGEYKINIEIYVVPVCEGKTRVFMSSPFSRGIIPTWVVHAMSNRFLNTDIWLHNAEIELRKNDKGDKAYTSMTTSDLGVNLWRKYWRSSGMINSPKNSYGPSDIKNLVKLSTKDQIDPWESHSKHCFECREALKTANKLNTIGNIILGFSIITPFNIIKCGFIFNGFFLKRISKKMKSAIRGEDNIELIEQRSVSARN
ncbi:putative phaeophorbide a oxygenase [Aureococcus anophagefferens virus]|uniref:Putative phaeophorbide a oxygenase n=1 Tax=Aureococcus anophagefferens virus TaxID=1474867 RepID=A0A076FFT9_9VIRU|nr:putative phaeophorbide a oxygenase [Aureococcus anophagefferens virus]AII17149.1 putative phaeophorbide a oxygenase [Aureococcus anophagefferens virus]UOG94283.1 pheophorbide a oxygenase [Aureococcus anophagefferens virus]